MQEEMPMGLEDLREDLDDDGLILDEEGVAYDEPENRDTAAGDEQLSTLMALESLVTSTGLVSQSMVDHFKEHLPSSHPVASFTTLPTRTNHRVALESIGGAIKLVALAGAVALIGGVGFLVFKIIKRRKLMPKSALDKKVSAAFASIEEKLKVGLDELNTMHPDVKHPTFNWSREEAVVRVGDRNGLTECQAEILSGKYPFMGERLYSTAATQGISICEFLETKFIKQVEHLMKMGGEDDITELETILSQLKFSDDAEKELQAYCKSLGIEVPEGDSPIQAWTAKYDVKLDQAALKSRIGSLKPVFKAMPEGGLKQLLIVQERMSKVFATLEKATKTLEGRKGEVGGNYATKLKELVQKAKEPLSTLADIFGISDHEVKAFNGCTRVKAEAIADGFSYVDSQYAGFAASDKGNAKVYKECQSHLRKLFSDVKDTIK